MKMPLHLILPLQGYIANRLTFTTSTYGHLVTIDEGPSAAKIIGQCLTEKHRVIRIHEITVLLAYIPHHRRKIIGQPNTPLIVTDILQINRCRFDENLESCQPLFYIQYPL